MNEPKTPNLGLNKIDRSSPSTTYFDLDKYLDQNWEKIDESVGQVEEKAEETAAQVSSIQERLDTEKRRSVTLEPGLQIINTERASAFKLEGLKGRTLVNLLGRDGDFGNYSVWNLGFGTKAIVNNIVTVTGNGTGINPQLTNYKHISSLTPKVGDKLFLRVLATHIVGTAKQLQLYLYSTTLDRFTAKNIDDPVNGTTYELYGIITVTQAMVDGWDATLGFKLTAEYATYEASNGSQVQFSKAAMYRVADEDKLLTSDQLKVMYPYIDSVQPVRNPYAIRYGENLLPPFYEWALPTGAIINDSYSFTYPYVSGVTAYNTYDLPIIPGQTYTLTINNSVTNVRNIMNFYDASGKKIETNPSIGTEKPKIVGINSVTYQAPVQAKTMRMYLYGDPSASGTATFSNPMLNIGSIAKPFKTFEEAMLALQTDIYADPLTGKNADEVFEKDGQYFKLKKWKKIYLDGLQTYRADVGGKGFKTVTLSSNSLEVASNSSPRTVKYDGKILNHWKASISEGDYLWFQESKTNFYLTISSADSGWGDSYTPTADEIKAYFMGWRMYDGGQTVNPYNGTGTKTWNSIKHWGTPAYYTATLPTIQAPEWTPYQLIYELARAAVEPITSEGQLTLFEGENQVEVGTGIVLRELARPIAYGTSASNINDQSSKLTKTTNRILQVYRDSKRDSNWSLLTNNPSGYGGAVAQLLREYDPSAAYSVTYLMLDVSPAVSFGCSYAINEKALLTSLSDIVQQNVAATSVLGIAIEEGRGLKNYVDSKPWQKFKITQDNGSVMQLPHSSNLNDIKKGGHYDCFNASNGPGGVANAWFYVEVLVHSNASTHVIQRASRLDTHNNPTLYMRTCMDNIWSAWSPDVFQSGVDAKNGIVDAISALGTSASMNDTWSTLANKIKQIKTGKQFATGQFVIGSNGTGSVNGLAFKPRHITFANATNTPNYIYYGIYSEESPRNNYGTGGTRVLNRVVGLDNGLSVDDKIIPTVNGFNVSGTGITDQRTYNYFATE